MAGSSTPDPGARRRNLGIAVLVVSTYLVMAANGGMFLLVVSLKQMAGDFDWPRTVPSLAYALFFAGAGLGGIAMGWWYDRRGAGPVTLLGLAMIGTGAVLVGSIDSRWQLYVIYGVMIGLLGYASIYGPLCINVMRWFEHRRGFAVGLVTAGEGIGGTIWPPVFRHLIETIGWRDTYLWFGVFVLVTALPLSVVLWRAMPGRGGGPRSEGTCTVGSHAVAPTNEGDRTAGSHAAARTNEGDRTADSHAAAWATARRPIRLSAFATQTALCLAIVGCCVSMAIPIAHLVAHASDLGHATARAAEMLAVALFISTVVRLVVGALVVDRFGGLVALLAFSGVQTAAMLFYAAVDGMLALYAASALFGIGYGGVNICYPVLVREHLPPAQAGRRLGVILLFGTLGMALGGWLAGYMFDTTGSYTPAFLAGAAFNVANLIIILGLVGRTRAGGGPSVRPAPA